MKTRYAIPIIALGLVAHIGMAETGTNAVSVTNELSKLNDLRDEKDLALVRKTYEQFFTRFPVPPDGTNSQDYADHAYRFHELLVAGGERKRGADMLRLALKSRLPRHIRRKVMMELAELDVYLAEHASGDERQKYLKEAEKILDSMMW